MKANMFFRLCFWVCVVVAVAVCSTTPAWSQDIRGQWVGNAKGTIFGAEGRVNITYQDGEDIFGIVEGQNTFGKAKFTINGKVRGNQIFGSKDGHTFQGLLYPDGTIRGHFTASTGDRYDVFLQRPNNQWGMPPGMLNPY